MRRTRSMLALAVSLMVLGGCEMEERVLETRFGFEPAMNEAERRAPASEPTHEESGGEWAIALGRLRGDDHQAEADRIAEQMRQVTQSDGVWVEHERGASMIYYGRYASRNDQTAQQDLRRWREYHRSGQMRLPALMLVPIGQGLFAGGREGGGEGGGDVADYALQRAAGRGSYTLQIGIYDEDYGDDYRRAAERAVTALREDGWEAFYWHGPVRSTVTVGVWDERLHEDDSPVAQQFQAVRREFPYNSLNGRTLVSRRGDEQWNQPSFPVRIPQN